MAEATRYLKMVLVPIFAERLLRMKPEKRIIFPVIQHLHSAGACIPLLGRAHVLDKIPGINVRLLGLLFMHVAQMQASGVTPSGKPLDKAAAIVATEYWKVVLIIEMVARVIKDEMRHLLRTKMRELCQPGEV